MVHILSSLRSWKSKDKTLAVNYMSINMNDGFDEKRTQFPLRIKTETAKGISTLHASGF